MLTVNGNSGKDDPTTHEGVIGELFLPNLENYPVIHHLSRNKRDNRVENFRWTTHSIVVIEELSEMSNKNYQKEFSDELPDG
jgi:hypothetical protein